MIPSLMLALFLSLILLINSRQLGVSSLNGYATANHSIGVLGITFGFLSTWYVDVGAGSCFQFYRQLWHVRHSLWHCDHAGDVSGRRKMLYLGQEI